MQPHDICLCDTCQYGKGNGGSCNRPPQGIENGICGDYEPQKYRKHYCIECDSFTPGPYPECKGICKMYKTERQANAVIRCAFWLHCDAEKATRRGLPDKWICRA